MNSQREVLGLALTHKASNYLHNALKHDKLTRRALLSSTGKQVVGRNKTVSSMSDYIDKRDYNEKTQGHVRALSNYKYPEKSQTTERMINTQRENCRLRHLNSLKDFDVWYERLVENIKFASKECVKNWESFARASENELHVMVDGFTQEYLLTKELEYVLAGYDMLHHHINKRNEEFERMKNSLNGLQREKMHSIDNFLSIMRKDLIIIAFLLPAEIDTLLSLKKPNITLKIERALRRVEDYTNKVSYKESLLKASFTSRLKEKEQFWRKVHHDSALDKFSADLSSKRYSNPEERVTLFTILKSKQTEIYNERLKLLSEITSMNMQSFSLESVDGFIEKINRLNDKAQDIYDKDIGKIVDFQKRLESECDEELEVLRSRLEYYAAEGENLLEVIDIEKKRVEAFKSSGRQLLSKVIKFLEENDLRAHEVCGNLGNYWKGVAKEFDWSRALYKEEEKKHELAIAEKGDNMDENVEALESKYSLEVDRLKRSITYEQLNQNLIDVTKTIESIISEYKSCEKSLIPLFIESHPAAIKNSTNLFLVKLGEKFGLLPAFQKEEYFQAYRERKLKELESSKPADDNKKKPGKKDDTPKVDLPSFEEISYASSDWLVLTKIEDVLRGLLVTEQDREKEAEARRIEEENKRIEEERRLAEEILRKEENKKGKKPEVRKVEEVKVEAEEKECVAEINAPVDPEGNFCLDNKVVIDLDIVVKLNETLLTNSINFAYEQLKLNLNTALESDRIRMDIFSTEISENLAKVIPRTVNLKDNEFVTRQTEIKRHIRRWERHAEDLTKKKLKIIESHVLLVKQLKDFAVNYKESQEDLRKQLSACINLAECQGLMRKSRDLELQLFKSSQNMLAQSNSISNEQLGHLIKSNSDFISGLALFEAGGNYDVQEVQYYQQKTQLIDKEIGEAQNKIKVEFEALIKKTETDRQEPIKAFEKEYAIVIENIAAKEGMGKKYGAPKRNSQERLRAEMTKCEKAQYGIESVIINLEDLIGEYKKVYESRNFYLCSDRSPSLSLEIRRVLISFRTCCQKYGIHLIAFKEESIGIKPLSWREDLLTITPSSEEISLEASRLEILLEPLEDIGVQKNPLNFWQRVMEIEKIAREETLKLFQGKFSVVPEFMEKYLKKMKSNAEEFRLRSIKQLRESSVKVFNIIDILSECVVNSLWFGSEYIFEQECEKAVSKLMLEHQKLESIKESHKSMLRPNLSNPSCRKDLEELDKAEETRTNRCKTLVKSSLDSIMKAVRMHGELFKTKLLNNTEVLLYLFDNLFVYDSFISLPGDQQLEIKRSHIKKLAKRKITGKAETGHVYKKVWPGLELNKMKLQGDQNLADSSAIQSNKTFGHKALVKFRNESFRCFSLLYCSKADEISQKLNRLLSEETRWNEKWRSSVQLLKVKNT